MGRIKTVMIKRVGKKLFREYKDQLTTDFDKNKEIISKVVFIQSKKVRNILAGYLTKLKKTKKEWEVDQQ